MISKAQHRIAEITKRFSSRMSVSHSTAKQHSELKKKLTKSTMSKEENVLIYYLGCLILLEQYNLANSIINKYYLKI